MSSDIMGIMGSSKMILPWLSCSPLDPRFAGSNPATVDGFSSERKNPEYDFLRKGSKAVGLGHRFTARKRTSSRN